MRLVIQAGMVSVEGKFPEHDKISKVMEQLREELFVDTWLIDDSDEEENLTDISFPYDENDFTIEQVRKLYNEIKRDC